ncbi:Putative D-alanyl-D-alanine carboxypeptidase [Streptomyces tendae]
MPATVDTPFDLASLTKLFTAVAAVQQIERGTLGLDARVGTYLPDFTAAVRHGITVRQLLTHTSGLRPELPLYDCADDKERLPLLRAERPAAAPGTYRYSDLNMLLLQHVLERLTGRTLDVLIRDGITRPLGMDATGFGPCPPAAATEDQRRPWAKADRGMLRGEVHDENAWALGGVAGHAGLFSTAGDLAVFCRTLLAGGAYGPARVLGPDHVDLMLRPPGLGFAVDRPYFMGALSGHGAAGHCGFTGTSLVLDRATDTFVVLLANTGPPPPPHPTGQHPEGGGGDTGRVCRVPHARHVRGGARGAACLRRCRDRVGAREPCRRGRRHRRGGVGGERDLGRGASGDRAGLGRAALDLGRELAAGHPALRAARWERARIGASLTLEPADLVTVSYVLNELTAADRAALVDAAAGAAQAVVIVEPGTPDGYARMIEARDRLIAAAPACPHSAACHRARHRLVPLLGAGQPLLAAPPDQGRHARLRGREVRLRRRDPPAGHPGPRPRRPQAPDP